MSTAAGFDGEQARIAAVQTRHETDLLRRANVVGLAPGRQLRGDADIGGPCLVVYVARKAPRAELSTEDLLPDELDGVAVDVQESGPIRAQQT